ncbi:MAG: DUF6356 family protein [Alphaproteobacteria bacterium]
MRQLHELFTDHPASVGETYGQHLGNALGFSASLLVAALACAVHAVFPFLCVKTGSARIVELHGRMVTNRDHRAAPTVAGTRRSALG